MASLETQQRWFDEQLSEYQAALQSATVELTELKRSIRALRGQRTRERNRLAQGQCPYCGDQIWFAADWRAVHIRERHMPKEKK